MATKVAAAREAGRTVVVVVSAMGDTTDELLALARQVCESPSRRELDMLLSAGERISMALLSMALNARGVPAVSFTGSQSGIVTNDAHTNARIVEVRPFRVQDELERGKVVIVAGYQGVSYRKEVTTLGRGGSDTTAVALAAALDADCEIYSDVDGVYTADPRVVPEARHLRRARLRGDAGARRGGGPGAERAGRRVREGAGHRDLRARDPRRRGETIVRRFPARTPGRVVGVASETGLVLARRCPRATRRARWPCSARLDERQVPGKQVLFHAEPTAAARRRSCSRSRTCTTSPRSARDAAPRFEPRLALREGVGAVSAIGAGINASFAQPAPRPAPRGGRAADAAGRRRPRASASACCCPRPS